MKKECCKVSFITVNYNGIGDTRALLQSIEAARLSFPSEVIVIDNGSRQDEFALLKQDFPATRGLYSATNLGFAGANNLGIGMAKGEYLYFLNNDALLSPQADKEILSMVAFLSENPSAGGLTPKIKYPEPPDLLQFAGCTPLSKITIRNRQIGYREPDRGQYEAIYEIPYLHGAAMFLPAAVVRHIGPMPEVFFLYYEELDWSCQIRSAYRLFYFPKASVVHKESASTGAASPLRTFYLTRNRILFARRNRQGSTRVLSTGYLVMAGFAKIVSFMVKGQGTLALAVVRGVLAAFKQYTVKKYPGT